MKENDSTDQVKTKHTTENKIYTYKDKSFNLKQHKKTNSRPNQAV